MATPTCTVESLTTAAACYKNFNSADRSSILIYFKALELAANGGTNYSAQLGQGGQLMDDAKCYRNLNNPMCPPNAFQLVLAYNQAVAAGAAPASTPDTIAAAIACNSLFTIEDKSAQRLLLECALGTHRNPPAG